MANWYCSREQVKTAAQVGGPDRHAQIDRLIEAESRRIDRETRRIFIPKTQTRQYRWPLPGNDSGKILWLDFDLISISTLQTKAQDSSPTTISASDFFLEPQAFGPPYDRIEIDLSSTAAFEAGDTPQRSISVNGSWGYSEDTKSSGTVASGLSASASATTMVCSDASLINVGDALLIESEQVFVSDRDFAALDSILLNGALTADKSNVTVTVDGSHGIVAGEIIRVDSEQLFVSAVSTNNLTVRRAFNDTVLAAHSDDTAVHINRTLTIERGVNGTTAATHSDSTAISKYEVPFDVNELCVAAAVNAVHQESAGWGREVGTGEGAREMRGRSLAELRHGLVRQLKRTRIGAI